MATKKSEPAKKKAAAEDTELTDHNRNTEADKEQKTPLVDGAGNKVIGGVSVEEE